MWLGLSNNFLVAQQHSLAITYNDVSVLENMHVSTLFQILREEELNVLASPTCQRYFSEIRALIIKSILGTDMSHHFGMIKEAKVCVHTAPFTVVIPPKHIRCLQSSVDSYLCG